MTNTGTNRGEYSGLSPTRYRRTHHQRTRPLSAAERVKAGTNYMTAARNHQLVLQSQPHSLHDGMRSEIERRAVLTTLKQFMGPGYSFEEVYVNQSGKILKTRPKSMHGVHLGIQITEEVN